MLDKPQILFLSHGGGPMPLLGDAGHADMLDCLKKIAAKLAKPSAILVISAHWEEDRATVTSGSNPSLIYDYYGFPAGSYQITYPCPGEPELAKQIARVLESSQISANDDPQRGFDHGLFVPLKIMFPAADIPCVQLSLLKSLNPSEHILLGQALQNLNHDNLLVIGSGFSFHNIPEFFKPINKESKAQNEAFEAWLIETCSNPNISEKEREQRLIDWQQAPAARYCHPREEHLLPLHVCYGLAQTACSEYFELQVLNKKASMYLWT
jgi:aromatic ring-opening dioxygenase catalytic subunit (LigB family)